jgi:hypothetical protein
MHRLWAKIVCLSLIACASAMLMLNLASAQTIISGDITGIVTDPSGAAVASAVVTLTSLDSGAIQTVTTDSTGTLRFPLLRPGAYKLQVAAPGFSTVTQTVTAVVGQVVSASVKVSVRGTSETIEVTGAAPILETESANLATTYTPKQIELTPNPGGDLTNYALSTPGVVLSTGAGYGNFTAYGMPGTSNLFTINGGDMNDPYSNLNNSGSSNNMLGSNEIQELSMVSNGYTGQYGRAAGVNMNFTTKSGSNSFHGNAKWDWNGRYLNANDWFNNETNTPRPFANSNQWGGSFGGPIRQEQAVLLLRLGRTALRATWRRHSCIYPHDAICERGAGECPGQSTKRSSHLSEDVPVVRGRARRIGCGTEPWNGRVRRPRREWDDAD